jgi:predicted nucleic acid-binding protein
LQVATQLELTAHDSPYVVLAMENGLILVTEDRKLQGKRKLIKAMSSDEVATLD